MYKVYQLFSKILYSSNCIIMTLTTFTRDSPRIQKCSCQSLVNFVTKMLHYVTRTFGDVANFSCLIVFCMASLSPKLFVPTRINRK